MIKTFSTKLDEKILDLLDSFCKRYHFKKSSLLEDIIAEGIERKQESLELAKSIEQGLGHERLQKLIQWAMKRENGDLQFSSLDEGIAHLKKRLKKS